MSSLNKAVKQVAKAGEGPAKTAFSAAATQPKMTPATSSSSGRSGFDAGATTTTGSGAPRPVDSNKSGGTNQGTPSDKLKHHDPYNKAPLPSPAGRGWTFWL